MVDAWPGLPDEARRMILGAVKLAAKPEKLCEAGRLVVAPATGGDGNASPSAQCGGRAASVTWLRLVRFDPCAPLSLADAPTPRPPRITLACATLTGVPSYPAG